MIGTTKRVFTLSLLSMALMGSPGAVSASGAECSLDYNLCLNSALQMDGAARELGSVECAAEWIGCTVGKLKFW
jgi:hypothetical protein